MTKTIVGIFDNYESAESAARKIKENGLRTDDISILAKQGEGNNTGNNINNTQVQAAETAVTINDKKRTDDNNYGTVATNDNISNGVTTGTVLGGLAGLLIGIGTIAVPGLGVIAAAGPITGLISGAVTGGIVGGLVDLGIPEEESREYEKEIKGGRILLTMKTDDNKVDRVASILTTSGAIKVETY